MSTELNVFPENYKILTLTSKKKQNRIITKATETKATICSE